MDKKSEYTRVPHEILEALFSAQNHFTPMQYKILLYIVRKTYGWNKYSEYISLAGMAKAIGHTRERVTLAVSDLEKMGVLSVDRRRGQAADISINDVQYWDREI